jgi:hypothetical protein
MCYVKHDTEHSLGTATVLTLWVLFKHLSLIHTLKILVLRCSYYKITSVRLLRVKVDSDRRFCAKH